MTVHGGKGTFPMADIHNDDPRDLLYLIAKSIAYPLANMFLGNVENGEVVVAFNPMWAERFGRNPKLTGQKSASKIGSNTIFAADITTRSATVGIDRGRDALCAVSPALGMYTRFKGWGW